MKPYIISDKVPLIKFAPDLKEIVKSNILHFLARRELKAQSEDGVIINALWEKIDDNLWGFHNSLYYMGREKQAYKAIDGEELERVIPLSTSKLAENIKRSSKDTRKILTSLNIYPENHPKLIRVGRVYRPIFFDPSKLEKRLREFVIDYERNGLYQELGLSVTDVTDVTGNITEKNSKLTEFTGDSSEMASTYVTSVTNCQRCRHFKLKNEQPFCTLLQSFLTEKSLNQPCNSFEETPSIDDMFSFATMDKKDVDLLTERLKKFSSEKTGNDK